MPDHRISDIANELGTTTTKVYRIIKNLGARLDGHTFKVKAITYLDDTGADLVRAASTTTTAQPLPAVAPTVAPSDNLPVVAGRLESLERGIMAMIEASKAEAERHRQEVAAVRAETARLTETVARLSSIIEARRAAPALLLEAPKPVEPWKPEQRPDPMQGKPLWYRAWVGLFEPERYRRH